MFQFYFLISFLLIASTNAFEFKGRSVTFELPRSENVRTLDGNILERVALLPIGSVISVQNIDHPENYDYRDQSGNIARSSNGFYSGVRIISVPQEYQNENHLIDLEEINNLPGGLYISTTILNESDPGEEITPLPFREIGDEYLQNFSSIGQPIVNFNRNFSQRFGQFWNREIELPTSQKLKWEKILKAMVEISDRTKTTDGKLLFVSGDKAKYYSQLYEDKGYVHDQGAWSIAVKGTAVRRGFPNVPCAEFVSEVIRQAYKRAGYSHKEDFNAEKDNELIWHKTAAVVHLTTALVKAGWIPWNPAVYKPMTGAPTMHATASYPGHAYISAGLDGRFIVDNGSPRGRDLGITSNKIIKMMYQTGVFFLPPGITPKKW